MIAGTLAATLAAAPAWADHSGDRDCSDFPYQEDAQDWLGAHPGDPDGLDGDGDGLACERLPHRPATPIPVPPAPLPPQPLPPAPPPPPAPCGVQGAIADRWYHLGGVTGVLGAPTTCELPTPRENGRYNHFQHGSIYWSPATGAWDVRGLIRDRWAGMGWENSWLGFPVTGELPTPTRPGAYNHFQGGSVYWCPETGAHAVRGLIRDRWASVGWEAGVLGCPTTGEIPLPDGAFTHFQGGSVYWSPVTGAHLVRGAIRDAWARQGWETGFLGFPTSDEYDVPGGRRSDFQGGSITWSPQAGAVVVAGPDGGAGSGEAVRALATLDVKGRAPRTGYDRDLFGPAWADVDRNGCDTRNDILRRDLTAITVREGTDGCIITTGTLADPYSGRSIAFVRGQGTSHQVEIDHVVALSDAWQKGAQQWDAATRRRFANDPLGLLAVDGMLNRQKGAGDAATWLPPNRAYRCDYVARQVAVKVRYGLWVTPAEKDAITGVLSRCPGQALPA